MIIEEIIFLFGDFSGSWMQKMRINFVVIDSLDAPSRLYDIEKFVNSLKPKKSNIKKTTFDLLI